MFADAVDFFIISLKKKIFFYLLIFTALFFLNYNLIKVDANIKDITMEISKKNSYNIEKIVQSILKGENYKKMIEVNQDINKSFDTKELGRKKIIRILLSFFIFAICVLVVKLVMNIFNKNVNLAFGNIFKYVFFILLLRILFEIFKIFFIIILFLISILAVLIIYLIFKNWIIFFLSFLALITIGMYIFFNIYIKIKITEISIIGEEKNIIDGFNRAVKVLKGKSTSAMEYFILLFGLLIFIYAFLYTMRLFISNDIWILLKSAVVSFSIIIYYFFLSFISNLFFKLEKQEYMYNMNSEI